ncbi:MAG: DNA repair protein RadA [Magnetococcales bacterium]|nr:DNA repair protein RadA [Magnetococcales bacterium]MBF0156101.1 DNA repair protein RadA [Magnetococcales bacterium]
MARQRRQYVCQECGADHAQWGGRCTVCGAWNTLRAVVVTPDSGSSGRGGGAAVGRESGRPVTLASVTVAADSRDQFGLPELDRVLGGGVVPGSAILIGGDPGIGKSTLLLGALHLLSERMRVLYVSGEESVQQLKLRSDRMGLHGDSLLVAMENGLEAVIAAVEGVDPQVLVMDSIQTLATDTLPAAAGTVTQVRECAARLIRLAKGRSMALFLVGHVTKEGQIAGPRVLEHMVDTVLYFEGERGHDYRLLRAVKNRFGAANEIGVFAMSQVGLIEVPNPSEIFLAERSPGAAGSVVFPGMEGSRPVLVEIQALVVPSPMAQPRRTTLGVDSNRLAMLTAVLEKQLGLGLFNHDIFLNIAGGFRITEPAADLAVVAALMASRGNVHLDQGLVVLGEVGLSGEIRAVSQVATRLKEAAKLGFTRAMLPERALKNLPEPYPLELEPVGSVVEAAARISAARG